MEERYLDVRGSRIRYVESGSGRNLVLVHGLGASADRWGRVMPLLSERFRVIAPDLVGFGLSDKPVADYTPEFFAAFLAEFLERVGAPAPGVIGSSLGGQVALELASSSPASVGRMVLVSPSGVMKHSTAALDAYVMAAMYPGEDGARRAFAMMEGSGRDPEPALVSAFVERMRMPGARMAFVSALLGLMNSEVVTGKLGRVRCPSMVVWGSRDPVIPPRYADAFVSGLGCAYHEMDGCGHTPYVQEPERFASAVSGFLS